MLDRGASGARRALLLRGWSEGVTLFADGPAELDAADADRLRGAGVAIDERRVTGLHGPGEELTAIAFADGDRRSCAGLLVPAPMHQRSSLPRQLGVETVDHGHVAVDAIEVDETFATSVDGVYAAGDAASRMPSVAGAVAAGSAAATQIVQDLV